MTGESFFGGVKIYRDTGKVITENWQTLVFLLEGSPAVTSLPYGQSSALSFDEEDTSEIDNTDGDDGNQENSSTDLRPPTKNLVENKRRKLEKNLSANQRDQVYLTVAREDLKMKEQMVNNMLQSSQNVSECINKMADAMTGIAHSIESGLGLIAKALAGTHPLSKYSRTELYISKPQ